MSERTSKSVRTKSRERVSESRMEAAFIAHPELLREYSNDISRQLPMGLYEGTVEDKNVVFPGDGADLDMWGLSSDKSKMVIYELKILKRAGVERDKSAMVGIISELMFYANYAYDMYSNQRDQERFDPSPVPKKDAREYKRLKDASEGVIDGIQAYFLTDKLHPLITPRVLKEMNIGRILYGALKYDWTVEGEEKQPVITKVERWFPSLEDGQ